MRSCIKSALRDMGDQFDRTLPHSARDLGSALERDRRLARDAA